MVMLYCDYILFKSKEDVTETPFNIWLRSSENHMVMLRVRLTIGCQR